MMDGLRSYSSSMSLAETAAAGKKPVLGLVVANGSKHMSSTGNREALLSIRCELLCVHGASELISVNAEVYEVRETSDGLRK